MPTERVRKEISLDYRQAKYPKLGEKVERNENLVRDYLSGTPLTVLQERYRNGLTGNPLTTTRLYQILELYRKRSVEFEG